MMETDFLNFRDQEDFSFDCDLRIDQPDDIYSERGSSFIDQLDPLRDDLVWDQEQEVNGDLAVIPNVQFSDAQFIISPKEDFHIAISDWQEHFTSELESRSAEIIGASECSTVNYMSSLDTSDTESDQGTYSTSPCKQISSFVSNSLGELDVGIPATKARLDSAKGDDDLEHFDLTSYVNGDFDDGLTKIKVEVESNSEDECVDVETVSESDQMPILRAVNLKTLLEQFEATEKRARAQQVAPEPVKRRENIPVELMTKVKTTRRKKSAQVIPAIPAKKTGRTPKRAKPPEPAKIGNYLRVDHDYCKNRLAKVYGCGAARKKISLLDVKEEPEEQQSPQKTAQEAIQDTALRIGGGGAVKAPTNKSPAKLTGASILRSQPMVKNADGVLMVSLLKTNTIITTTKDKKVEPKQQQQPPVIKVEPQQPQELKPPSEIKVEPELLLPPLIKVEPPAPVMESQCKRRKLNLEEYKKRREIFKATSSTENSRGCSPISSPAPAFGQVDEEAKKIAYQELLLRMASEILTTPAKPAESGAKPTICEFVPPDQLPAKVSVEQPKEAAGEQRDAKSSIQDVEMITIVSVGVNTDISVPIDLLCTDPSSLPASITNITRTKLSEIKPILEIASEKIGKNSLISDIKANLKKNIAQSLKSVTVKAGGAGSENPGEHGEDKTIIVLDKNRIKPKLADGSSQTEDSFWKADEEKAVEKKKRRQYRARRSSSSSSDRSSPRSSPRYKKPSSRTNSANSTSSSRSSYWSRSWSRSPSRSHSDSNSRFSDSSCMSSSSRSRSRSLSPHCRYYRDNKRSSYRRSISPVAKKKRADNGSIDWEKVQEVEERRVVFVGGLGNSISRGDLERRFEVFGPITKLSIHVRERGSNFGFVTYAYKEDAYRAVEHGNDDESLPHYDINFGGRRTFCKTKYADLDNVKQEDSFKYNNQGSSFDALLREAQAKLLKRKA